MPHRPITGRLVIATHNPGKLTEMRDLLAIYGVDAISAGELGFTGAGGDRQSFAANARIKAQAAATAANMPAFADNSGLVVDALDGEPGIHSARWAGPSKDFAAAMNTIHTQLSERGAAAPEQRRAHFVSALCVAWPDGHVEEFEAGVDGTLVWPPRGDQGFGYDPLFLPDGHTPHLRRNVERGEARPAAARARAVASGTRFPQAGGGVSCQALTRPHLASTCTGRSACRSAPIATSTATSATLRSTRRGSGAPSKPRSPATAARVPGRTVASIFLGGGTPSLMQPATVGAILDAIGRHWTIAPDVEVTLEANPTSVEATRFRGYRAAGVNRVSLGVQALDDAALKELGRLHTAKEALDAVAVARANFERYSFDLIYARPRQTPQQWAGELHRAIAEAAEHLSLYQLTIEPDTPFASLHAAGKLVVPDEDPRVRSTT